MPSKTTTQGPSLLRARDSLLHPETEDPAASAWETGLSFDDLRSAIGKSFSGIPGKADGEPICSWMIAGYNRDSKVKDETMKLVVSVPLYETMTRRTFFDMSVRTNDGAALASTTVLVDYRPKSALGRWWDKLLSKWHENILVFKLWRQGSLPESFVSKEWRAERDTLYRRARIGTGAISELHEQFGPRHRHWYVHFVASNPDVQGQGYGSKIMRKICELADKERADCYLDCGQEKNKAFYERFGFVVVASRVLESGGDVEEAADQMIAYGMVRKFKAYK